MAEGTSSLFTSPQGGELVVLVVSGSHAHGLAQADSDLDLRGVYVAPTTDFLRLGNPREHIVMHRPDVTVFELRKFCRLAAQGNPNILEMLFTPDENIVVASPTWQQLVTIRQSFLSRIAYNAYRGYALAQWHDAQKLANAGEAVHRWKERTRQKHLTHVFRVLDEGEQLFKTGTLHVRVQDVAGLRELSQRPIADLSQMIKARIDKLAAIPCPFPEEADWAAIDDLLLKTRQDSLAREQKEGPQSWNLSEVDYASRGWAYPVEMETEGASLA